MFSKAHLLFLVLSIGYIVVLEAAQIAHYDFSDGDLYDNELGSSYTLFAQGEGSVTLNDVDGTALFPSATSSTASGWLEASVDLAPDDFTISFWFRTEQVDQNGQFQGLFSSGSSGVTPGTWQIHSDGVTTGGNLAGRFNGNNTSANNLPQHSAGTWNHLVVRKESDAVQPTSVYLTPITEPSITSPVFESTDNNSTLDKFAFGVNRGGDQSYGMEISNVRIFDDSNVSLSDLYDEGPIAGSFAPSANIVDFNADDRYVSGGSSVQLTWEVEEHTTLSIDQGVGDVTSLTTNGSGQIGVMIDTTTTFTLTASNSNSSREASITIYVGPPKPNIIVFIVDDMGITDTSVPFIYEGETPKTYAFNSLFQTPNMETLASQGMLFSKAYAQTVCSPTRVSLMTGLNSTGHAVTTFILRDGGNVGGDRVPANYRQQGMTDPSESTLPKWLSEVGYRTISVGKGHFTYQGVPDVFDEEESPTFIGFDVNIGGGYRGQPASYLPTNHYNLDISQSWEMPGLEDYYQTDTFLTRALTLEASKEVTESSVDLGQPFFLYLSHYAVHTPFETDPDATGDYTSAGAVGTDINKFCTMVEGVDRSLGEMIDHLENLNIAEETLIILLGDNGSDNPLTNNNALPDKGWDDFPLRGRKGNKDEGGIRVPLLISWAKRDANNPLQQALPIPLSSHENDMVTVWDLPVTIAKIAGAPIPVDVHGYDLSAYLSGTPGTHRPQEILIYHPHFRGNGDSSGIWANYYKDGYKLHHAFSSRSYELYNLATDPTESMDLLNGTVSLETEKRLLTMARAMARTFDSEWGAYGALWPQYINSDRILNNGLSGGSRIDIMGTLDIDEDGLEDRDEDLNGNGLVDSGETDPDDVDSDQDGSDDFSEQRLGLNPTNPNEFFKLSVNYSAGNGHILTWPSQPGLTFTVHRSADLTSDFGSWDSTPNIQAGPSESTTWTYTGPASSQFFVIELE